MGRGIRSEKVVEVARPRLQRQAGGEECLPVMTAGLRRVGEAVRQAADHVMAAEKRKEPVGHRGSGHGCAGAVGVCAAVKGDNGFIIDNTDDVSV